MMRSSSKGRFGIITVGLLAVVGIVVWWATQQGKLPTVPASIVDSTKQSQKPVTGAGNSENTATETSTITKAQDDKPEVAALENPPEVAAPKTWEDHLDDILLSDDNENAKADQILALMPSAPPESQEELAQHLVNMVQDDHYEGASNLLMNVNTQTNVADILLNDVLNRNN
ncbi:MAG: hypothetical protein JWO95_1278, partial [Verrucomicrobiales bacterium]|nr:hypothetical protein [Verrucomicrobiales bacterium]